MEKEISLGELFTILKNHINKIVLWSFMGIILTGVYTFFLVTPQYQSTSKLVVNQTQNTGNSITNTDIQTNLNLINTYQSIIIEPIILEEAIIMADSKVSVAELADKISIETQNNSLVFAVTVTDDNPYTSADLANGIATSFESNIGDILEVESVTILSKAEPNVSPVSPNTLVNLLMGATLGFIIGVSIALLSEFKDKRVKDSKIIEELGWSNLGSVLEMSTNELKETRIEKQNKKNISTEPSLSRRRV